MLYLAFQDIVWSEQESRLARWNDVFKQFQPCRTCPATQEEHGVARRRWLGVSGTAQRESASFCMVAEVGGIVVILTLVFHGTGLFISIVLYLIANLISNGITLVRSIWTETTPQVQG